eukprot:scaffold4112_cov18-Tisochrysis_lutea.AAC.1
MHAMFADMVHAFTSAVPAFQTFVFGAAKFSKRAQLTKTCGWLWSGQLMHQCWEAPFSEAK